MYIQVRTAHRHSVIPPERKSVNAVQAMIAAHCTNYTVHTNTLCARNSEILLLNLAVTFSKHYK